MFIIEIANTRNYRTNGFGFFSIAYPFIWILLKSISGIRSSKIYIKPLLSDQIWTSLDTRFTETILDISSLMNGLLFNTL